MLETETRDTSKIEHLTVEGRILFVYSKMMMGVESQLMKRCERWLRLFS
jgi:hypothetical protein